MARRQNPFGFTLDPEATKIAREEYPRWRSITSLTSPIKHRAITEDPRVVRSPHNFHVAVVKSFGGSVARGAEPYGIEKLVASHIRPDAVTLVATPRNVGDIGKNLPPKQRDAESLYTAFTYLHRLGDELIGMTADEWDPVLHGRVAVNSVFYDKTGRKFNAFSNPWQPPAAFVHAQRALDDLCRAFLSAMGVAPDDLEDTYFWKAEVLFFYIVTHVDSKMVREGYTGSSTQAVADLFALAELTTKPLLRPIDPVEMQRFREMPQRHYGRLFVTKLEQAVAKYPFAEAEIIDALNAYGVQFNILWRRWYNALIPALYGTGVLI